MIVAGGGNDVVHGLDGNDEICGPGNASGGKADRLKGLNPLAAPALPAYRRFTP